MNQKMLLPEIIFPLDWDFNWLRVIIAGMNEHSFPA